MKYLSTLFLTALVLTSCSSRRSTLSNGGYTNVSSPNECPSGMSANVSLVNSSASSLITGQSITFNVTASGCSYGYLMYLPESSTPIPFASSTSFSRTYALPQNNIRETVIITVLRADGQPAAQTAVSSQTFSVTQAVQPLTCTVEPSLTTLPIQINSSGQPVMTAPPVWNASIRSSVAARVKSVTTPSNGSLQFSSSTPVPGSSYAVLSSVSSSVLKLISGSYEFEMQSADGATARCAGSLAFSYQATGGTSLPQYLYRGDVNGDGVDDIISWDAATGVFWAAIGVPGGNFNYINFGSLGVITLRDAFLSDFNKDGKTDILIRVQSTGMWKLGLSNGMSFQFIDLGMWPASPALTNLELKDVNGDGRMDIVGVLGTISYVSYLSINGTVATISSPVVQEPVLTLTAAPTSVAYNGSSVINWTSTNTTSCVLKAGSTTVSPSTGANLSGSYNAMALTANTAFTLECVKSGGTATVSQGPVNITVGAPPASAMNLIVRESNSASSANASIVDSGSKVYLTWTTSSVSSCSVYQGSAVLSSATSGSAVASNALTGNTLFKLRCVNLSGVASETAPIAVQVVAKLSYAPNSNIDFGTVLFAQQSNGQKLRITNAANVAIAKTVRVILPAGFVYAGGDCFPGAYSEGAYFQLNAGAGCDVLMKFAPVQAAKEKNRTYSAFSSVSYDNGRRVVTDNAVLLKGVGNKSGAANK